MSEAPDLFAEAMAAVAAVPKTEDAAPEAAPDATDTPVETPQLDSEPPSTAEATPPAPEAEKPAVEAPRAPAEAPPVANDRFAPRFAKLMERESALVAKEQSVKAAEAEVAAARAALAEFEAAKARFKANPTAFLRQLAPEMKPADLAKSLWYEHLGEDAPIEHRVTKTERAAKQELDELRAEIERNRIAALEAEQARVTEEAHHRFVGALGSVATAVPEQYPLVKSFSAQDPERVTRALYRMAQKHARATNGEVLEPLKYAAMLESELSALKQVVAPTAAAPAPAPAAPPTSLRNTHSSVQPPKTIAMTEDEKFEEALKAAQAARSSL